MKRAIQGWVAWPVVAIVLYALPLPRWLIETGYGRVIYPRLQAIVTWLSNLAPIALLDVLIVLAIALTVRWLVRLPAEWKSHGAGPTAVDLLKRLSRAAGVAGVVFLVFWGLNYRRPRLPAAPTITVEDTRAIAVNARDLATRVRASANADTRPSSYEELALELEPAFEKALTELGRPSLATTGRPKYSLLLTSWFTWTGVNGMINPFVLESLVHPDLLTFERPFVLAHEWAHLAGFADEAEASAVGWLACMHGSDRLAYSASMFLLVESGGALPAAAWRDVSRSLDEGIRNDLQALRVRWARQRPIVRQAANRVYDEYLKANRVDDGVASYSRAVALIAQPPFQGALISRPVSGPR